tara:strand:- start:25 stop:774 length:750 start_codon:yes stop_codon:yes gene_type:complete
MKNFLHVYRFGEELTKEGFNVVYPIKVTDTNWLSMLGISGPDDLSIKDVNSYHFQKPIKAYTPQDVLSKLRDNVSAYAIRINSKMNIKELRTADNEEHIELSWYDMYRRKHLWPKTNIKINLHNIIIDVMTEVHKAEWYFSQQDNYCPYCGTICTNQLRPYDESKERSYEDQPEHVKKQFANLEEHDTQGTERLVQNLICEGIDCTYKKVKTRVMLSPSDKRKQILPRVGKEYYYYEEKLVKKLDYLDE